MTRVKNRSCADCHERCTGYRCQACSAKQRVGKPRGTALDGPRLRPQEPRTRDLYPIPVPSPDTSPLTLTEMDKAKCVEQRNQDICFPEDNSTIEAKILCSDCPIAARCLAVAIANNEKHGLWGGATLSERNHIRAQMLRTRGTAA